MSKRAYVIHGYGGFPEEGWRPWLRRELEEQGFTVVIPAMPNTNSPELTSWVSALSAAVGMPDGETVFIGHSLGCITILRYLESLPPTAKVGKVILVAAFAEKLDDRFDAISHFMEAPVDWEKIRSHGAVFHVIHSDDDSAVPVSIAESVAKNLGVTLELHHGLFHFSGDDGVTEVPMVTGKILEMKADELFHFLDDEGKLVSWPAKSKKQMAAIMYLAEKVKPDKEYTEREMNELLDQWHTFGDSALLRRELFMKKFIDRKSDGSAYWKTKK